MEVFCITGEIKHAVISVLHQKGDYTKIIIFRNHLKKCEKYNIYMVLQLVAEPLDGAHYLLTECD